VRLIDDWDGFGQRRTGTGTTVFTNVAVSNDEVLSDTPYDADPVPTVQYASLQLYIHAVVAGILASVVDDGVALLRSRDRSFSHALAERPTDDPLYQKQLGELAATAFIARAPCSTPPRQSPRPPRRRPAACPTRRSPRKPS
jgi:alkylation response protein AidB-like acyl-CoA dehydrogenase